MVKKVSLVLFGVIIGIIVFVFIDYEINKISDRIALYGLIINAIIGIYLVTFIQNRVTNSRAAKDYFINKIEKIRQEYEIFLCDIKNNTLTSIKIKKEFKGFSEKFTSLEKSLKEYHKLRGLEIQKRNREIHQEITESFNFNSIYQEDVFFVDDDLSDTIPKLHNNFNDYLTSIVIKINDK